MHALVEQQVKGEGWATARILLSHGYETVGGSEVKGDTMSNSSGTTPLPSIAEEGSMSSSLVNYYELV